jgi:hypothetical protein
MERTDRVQREPVFFAPVKKLAPGGSRTSGNDPEVAVMDG